MEANRSRKSGVSNAYDASFPISVHPPRSSVSVSRAICEQFCWLLINITSCVGSLYNIHIRES